MAVSKNGSTSGSTTWRPLPGRIATASGSAVARDRAPARRRARATRVSRRARAIMDRAAASRTSKAGRCRSRGGCRSAASRIRSASRPRSCVSMRSTQLPEDAEVTRETSLAEAGLIRAAKGQAKLLANGDVARAVTVRGIKMSAGRAREDPRGRRPGRERVTGQATLAVTVQQGHGAGDAQRRTSGRRPS